MIREGDATVLALGDGADMLPSSIVESFNSGGLFYNVPYPQDFTGYIPFAVFGVSPVEELGHWCGCIEVVFENVALRVRLFHRKTLEQERRVLMLWDERCPAEGHIVLVENFEVMKDFFRLYKETWRTKSVKGVVN